MKGNHRVWPRDRDRYAESIHFDYKKWKRSIPKDAIAQTISEGEFYNEDSTEKDVGGFTTEIEGIGVVVIGGASIVGRPAILITTWAYLIDESEARSSSRWSRKFIQKTKDEDQKYAGDDEEIPHPPAYREHKAKRSNFDDLEEKEGSEAVERFKQEHPKYSGSAAD